MRSVKAIFRKQYRDMMKNMSVLVLFVAFPLVAFFMTRFVASGNPDIPDTRFVTMMAGIFVGMGIIQSACGVIAEDREKKSLRFLVMAGVKPSSYLLGVGGVIFFFSLISSLAFALIGGFISLDDGIFEVLFSGIFQREFLAFMAVMLSGAIASIILGATIGMLTKNQQSATGVSMPFAMVLGFGPLLAEFNEQAERVLSIFYTLQINTIINDFSAGLARPMIIIWINIAVLAVVFIIAYTKKGLKN